MEEYDQTLDPQEKRFREIYDSTLKQVAGYLYARCRQEADLEDLLQETYLQLFQVIEKEDSDYIKSPIAFAIHIAKQQLYKYYKFRSRADIVSIHYEDGNERTNVSEAALYAMEASIIDGCEDQYIESMMVDFIKEDLKQESPVNRKIILMHYDLDMTLQEIADCMCLPLGTIKSKYYRFLEKLRDMYKEINYEKEG